VRLRGDQLQSLAKRPDIISIQPFHLPEKFDERQAQIVAGNLREHIPTGPGYLAWLTSNGFAQTQFSASAFVVDVTDSGLDNGTVSPAHFALYEMGNIAGTSRVVYNRLEGSANPGSTIQGCSGHGNINAHILAAFSDASAGFPHTDSAGFRYDLGVCPFVKVGSSVIFDPKDYTYPNLPNLQSRAYRDGARVSANSWGAYTAGGYDVLAQTF